MSPRKAKKRMGQILLEAEVITEGQLSNALKRQGKNGQFLSRNLVDLGYVDEDEITQYIAEQYGIPYLSLGRYKLNEDLLGIIPEDISKMYGLIPLDLVGDILTVGVVEAPDEDILSRMEELTGFKIQVMLVTAGDFNRCIQKIYNSYFINDNEELENTEVGRYLNMPSYEGGERRRFPRVRSEIRIKYETKNEYNINSSINVSRGGVLVRSKSPAPVDSYLVIRMELPTSYDDIIVISRVVRVERVTDRNVYLIALNFSSMDARDNIRLAEFIKSVTKNH